MSLRKLEGDQIPMDEKHQNSEAKWDLNREMAEQMLAIVPIPSFIIDSAGKITGMNAHAKERLEITVLERGTKFTDVMEVDEFDRGDDHEWNLLQNALNLALDEAAGMRRREGQELMKDLTARVQQIEKVLTTIERSAKENIPRVRSMLEERAEASPAGDEPSLPLSRERFLTHPVHGP